MRTILASLGLALLPSLAVAGDGWYADFDEAARAAKEQKKDLLVDFTGSDWCGWCKRLKAEVFDHEAFLEPAREHFVLVALDFPNAQELKDRVPNPARNRELAETYAIRGYPTVLLMTPEGHVYGRTGYMQGGPEPYVEHLDKLRTEGRAELREVLDLLEAWKAAEGEERAKLVTRALERLERAAPDDPAVSLLAEPAKGALALDPTNERGLKLRAVKALVGAGQLDEEVRAAAKELDPKNELGIYEQLVSAQVDAVGSEPAVQAAVAAIDELVALGPIQDGEIALKLYVSAATWNVRFLADPVAAKRYARLALPLAAENPRLQEMLQGIIDQA